MLIPRGGKNLIDTVVNESTVPVLETGAGNCHIFIDETADYDMSEKIVLNGKTQRPSVCNATESLLIHERWFEKYGTDLLTVLHDQGIELYGDQTVCTAFPDAKQATEEDWATEYLALKLSVKIIKNT